MRIQQYKEEQLIELATRGSADEIRDFFRNSIEDNQLLVEVASVLAEVRTLDERRGLVRMLRSYVLMNPTRTEPNLRLVVG